MSRWHGPCVILKKRSKSSYLVDMGDGSKRVVHVNKIRKYLARTMVCGLVVDEDEDFGRVYEMPVKNDKEFKTLQIEYDQIKHLSLMQQKQLIDLLSEFHDRFSDKPGLCTV